MGVKFMKNLVETIRAEVEALGTGSILRELEGGMFSGMCESFDMRVAVTDRNRVINLLIKKRIEERT
jgi:hypothetical protein